MAEADPEELKNRGSGPQWTCFHGAWMIGGERDVFLLASLAPPASSDVVPRGEGRSISEDDTRKLENQGVGVSTDELDDLNIVRARIALDQDYRLSREMVSTAKNELTRDYVLGELEDFLNQVETPGGTIHYMGNGKKGTGDWCFKDGSISFSDIIHLYNSTKIRGRCLTIVTDCSHSGAWVEDCARYLDQLDVKPCAHSMLNKRVLVKVYASCRRGQHANSLTYSVKGMINEKNRGDLGYFLNLEMSERQHTFGFNFTSIRCGRRPEDECLFLAPHYTWNKVLIGHRLHLVRGKDRGQPAWHYVILIDDEKSNEEFMEKANGGTVDVAKYGSVLQSGWGKNPPNEVIDEIEKQYSRLYT